MGRSEADLFSDPKRTIPSLGGLCCTWVGNLRLRAYPKTHRGLTHFAEFANQMCLSS